MDRVQEAFALDVINQAAETKIFVQLPDSM